jgi:transcription antitermination factor NusG
LANFIRNDPIIDYLDLVNKNGLTISDSLTLEKLVPTHNPNKKRKTSFDYIVEEGYKFEEKIIDKIKEYMRETQTLDLVITIAKAEADNINAQFEKTKEIINLYKYEVILGGLLINTKNSTYGYPDIIVMGSWINKFIDCPPTVNIDPGLYYIIDIKSSTINLINGGKYVSSSNLFEGYKTQIWVYKEALDQIQNCESNFGFILGKKYKYALDNREIHINNSFYTLGLIDYSWEKTKGNDIKDKVKKAVKWSKELKKNWRKYKLYPISNKIRPNMKNSFDKNHKKIKRKIANKNNEITLLWNCGIIQRNNASKMGITKYSDLRLSADKLGFEPTSSRHQILNSMLKTTHSNNLISINKKNNHNDWQHPVKYEFFVDFETYIPTFDENLIYENEEDEPNDSQSVYMIGAGYMDNDIYRFKCFIISYLGSQTIYKNAKDKYNCTDNDIIQVSSERVLVETFINWIYSFKKNSEPKYRFLKNVILIHWSWAEPCLFAKKLAKYNMNTVFNTLPWFDLMEVFKNSQYPITIKNCFSFSLKEITKALNGHGLINLEWSDLDDGLLSAFIARDIYKNFSLNKNLNNSNMEDIVEYNYIDCKALYLILDYIRNYIFNNKYVSSKN